RKWWKIGAQRRRIGTQLAPDWALAVFSGIVRAVYRLERWEQPTDQDVKDDPSRAARWAFHGERDHDMETIYLHRDVSSYLRSATGAPSQTPVRYVNCE